MAPPETERIKVRGLTRIAAFILGGWGGLAFLKGLYDLFAGEPEANLYAPVRWAFVTRPEWLRYAAFECSYGLACAGLAWALWRYGRFLPETIERKRRDPEYQLFD